MHDVASAPVAEGTSNRFLDRRTLLVGAAGALAATALSGPARAAGSATSAAARRRPHFDPALARQLQQALRDGLSDPATNFPGAILHVHSPTLGAWTGVAGLGRLAPATPMRPGDRFRAGSIVKPFVATAVLQLAERGKLSLDARLPDVLPTDVTRRFTGAADITVRMLLGHRSGIAEWDLPAIDLELARHPTKVWKVSEFLDLAAAQPPVFAPGQGFFYSNTDYNLLGLVIERITGRSWRHEVTRRVIAPLRLTSTSLPAPGNRSITGAHAHGYLMLDGKTIDLTRVDPSFAGAAGASALITAAGDLARFIDALFDGRLFRPPDAETDARLGPGAGRGRPGRLRPRDRTARPARRRRAGRSPGRRPRLPLLHRARTPIQRHDLVCAQHRGGPDRAGHPGGEGARSDNLGPSQEQRWAHAGARSPVGSGAGTRGRDAPMPGRSAEVERVVREWVVEKQAARLEGRCA
jgi:D-alanyl-D-alanine carboxypeptidase